MDGMLGLFLKMTKYYELPWNVVEGLLVGVMFFLPFQSSLLRGAATTPMITTP